MGWVEVEPNEAGQRLDLFLAGIKEIGTRSRAQRMIKTGLVQIVGEEEAPTSKRKVVAQDEIEWTLPHFMPEEAKPVAFDLDIRLEDESVILVNKPRGMVVHPSIGHIEDSLVNYLLHHTSLGGQGGLRPGIVHRIDKDTSGLLVVAKTDQAMESLARQFAAHSIERRYLALCWGETQSLSGTIDLPLGRHKKDRKRFDVVEGGKRAVTHWRRLEVFEGLSLLECRLETGRTHQIRVHLTHMGHPLVGDPVYGRARDLSPIYPVTVTTALKNFLGQALHAAILGFVHPASGQPVLCEAELPEDMALLLRILRDNPAKSKRTGGKK